MKKLILISLCSLFLAQCFAFKLIKNTECEDYINSLNLPKAKQNQIAKIENEARTELAQINARILLKRMELQQLQGRYGARCSILNEEIKNLLSEEYELQKEKERQIASSLPFFKRRGYYCNCSNID